MALYQLSLLSDHLRIFIIRFLPIIISQLKALKKKITSMPIVESEKVHEELKPLEKLTPEEEAILEQFYLAGVGC